MKVLSPLQTRTGQIVLDALICVTALLTAYLLRFEGRIPESYIQQLVTIAPVIVIVRAVVHWSSGIYRVVWRYVGIRGALLFVRSVVVVSAGMLVLRMVLPVRHASVWM